MTILTLWFFKYLSRLKAESAGDILDQDLRAAICCPKDVLIYGAMQYIYPFNSAIRHPLFQIWMVCLGILQLCFVLQMIHVIKSNSIQEFRQFRFEDKILLNDSFSISFLQQGCSAVNFKFDNNITFTANFTSAFVMDGYAAIFTSSPSKPIYFAIEGSNDDWTTYQTVASPSVRWTRSGLRFLRSAIPPRSTIVVDYRLPWPWYLNFPLVQSLLSMLFLGIGISGLLGAAVHGKKVCLFFLALQSAAEMAASVGFLFLNNAKESFAPFCGFILYGSLLLVLLRAEGYLFEASTALAFLAIGVTAFNECCLFQDCENFTNDPPVQFLLVAALFSAMLLLRRRFLVHAARGVLPDQAAGERDWLHLLSADGPAIASLDTLACRLAQR